MAQSSLNYTTPPGRRCSLCPEPAVFHVYRSGGGVAEADACEEHREEVVKNLSISALWVRIMGAPTGPEATPGRSQP